MTKSDLEKIIATAVATGTIVIGASIGINKANCDYVVLHQGGEICVTAELKEAIESGLRANSGFGGVSFGK